MVEGVIHRKHSVSIVVPRNSVPVALGGLEANLTSPRERWESGSMEHEDPRRRRLTKRETEVLWLIAFGHTDESISVVLGNRRTTISNHVSSILKKLNATSRASAVWQGVKLGILTSELADANPRNLRVRCACGMELRGWFKSDLRRMLGDHYASEHGLDLTDEELDKLIGNDGDSH